MNVCILVLMLMHIIIYIHDRMKRWGVVTCSLAPPRAQIDVFTNLFLYDYTHAFRFSLHFTIFKSNIVGMPLRYTIPIKMVK